MTSSATGHGLDDLRRVLLERVPLLDPVADAGPGAGEDELADFAVFRPAAGRSFEIDRGPGGEFRLAGEAVERLFARYDLDNEEAAAMVEHRLRRMGVIAALEKAGFEPGDDIEVAGVTYELDPT